MSWVRCCYPLGLSLDVTCDCIIEPPASRVVMVSPTATASASVRMCPSAPYVREYPRAKTFSGDRASSSVALDFKRLSAMCNRAFIAGGIVAAAASRALRRVVMADVAACPMAEADCKSVRAASEMVSATSRYSEVA